MSYTHDTTVGIGKKKGGKRCGWEDKMWRSACVGGKENRGKGEIKKTKGEENTAEKKTEEK